MLPFLAVPPSHRALLTTLIAPSSHPRIPFLATISPPRTLLATLIAIAPTGRTTSTITITTTTTSSSTRRNTSFTLLPRLLLKALQNPPRANAQTSHSRPQRHAPPPLPTSPQIQPRSAVTTPPRRTPRHAPSLHRCPPRVPFCAADT